MNNKQKIKNLSSIQRYINGELGQEEIDDLWVQFLEDPELHRYFITEVHLQNLIRKGRRPPGFGTRPENQVSEPATIYKVWMYAAAAVVLFVILLQWFTFGGSAMQNHIAALSFDDIHLSEMVGTDVYRSESEENEETNIAINQALALAYENEQSLAIQSFRELLDAGLTPQQQVRVELNLGIIFYNRGEYREAAEKFTSVAELEGVQEAFTEKGWWFLGNTLLRLRDAAGAREAIFNAYQMNGRYQSPAFALLEKLEEYSEPEEE